MTTSALSSFVPRPGSPLGGAVGVLIALFHGLVWALVEPRGPVTGLQAALLMATAAVAGWGGGRLLASRWAILALPLAHVAGFELGRLGSSLPSVGPVVLDSVFGVLALALGRLIPWLLATLPLAVGAAWGTRRPGRRPIALAAVSAAVALLAGWVALPATVEPVRAPGGFAELVEVELGGHRQWIEVRGTDRDNPVLLYLSGGPGQSDLAFSRVLLEPLLDNVTLVAWDQRGTGKSYPALDEDSLTLDRAIDDVVELARLLTVRFGQPRIHLLGESWGSLLGVQAVQRAPELFGAYIASGQMADVRAVDTGIYTGLLEVARERGDDALVAELTELAPPPYPSVLDYGRIMALYPLLEGEYTPPAGYRARAAASNVGFWGLLGSEYAPIDKLNVLRGLLDMFSVMYPQLQEVDLRRSVTRLEVPVFVLCGDHEIPARTTVAREWFDGLSAPSKRWYQLPDAGHAVAFEQVEVLEHILTTEVPPTDA